MGLTAPVRRRRTYDGQLAELAAEALDLVREQDSVEHRKEAALLLDRLSTYVNDLPGVTGEISARARAQAAVLALGLSSPPIPAEWADGWRAFATGIERMLAPKTVPIDDLRGG